MKIAAILFHALVQSPQRRIKVDVAHETAAGSHYAGNLANHRVCVPSVVEAVDAEHRVERLIVEGHLFRLRRDESDWLAV